MADELLFTKENKIATITLNRPEKLNAFHDGMLADWAAALRECQADDGVNVVVLTGNGRVFCAGGGCVGL
ncbi:enoyl-CoA hydratase/isomerase family protein [Candidatus Entotheonella palauensis]|uniref:enoyl-CoA hydratase/isomerase family protein n=1 Tax=Candidatus Entotheonella palauensis TaxID=93172 RepID=UPI0021176B8C|nr:enoyl-CoA hydratase/isomerase family protein [Candidatus Entotheonella palauensis]